VDSSDKTEKIDKSNKKLLDCLAGLKVEPKKIEQN
jgi:hypothetical protein